MTTWDYRIVQDGELFYVTDVYYDDDGRPSGYGKPHRVLESDDLGDLAYTISAVMSVMTKPLLRVADGELIAVDQL